MDRNTDCQIRFASGRDVPLLLTLIRELAVYERMLDEVVATEELLNEWLFEKKLGEALIGELNGEPVAFALFFYNFSTFLGRSGIYLEDIYVRPEARGNGIGTNLLRYIAGLAVERGCGRLELSCLDWNESGIAFYRSHGAVAMSDWTVYRFAGEALKNLGTVD